MSIIAEALKKAEKVSGGKKTKKEKIRRPGFFVKNTRKKNTGIPFAPMLIFAASLIFFAVFLSRFFTAPPPRPAESSPSAQSYTLDAASGDRQTGIDPSLFITQTSVNGSIKLNGVMYKPDKALAVINGSIWAEGDRIGNFKIDEIGRDFVRVSAGKREFVVRLKR